MELSALTAVSPIDGRYGDKTVPLRSIFSEYGLIERRVRVEIAWLLALCDEPLLPETGVLTTAQRQAIQAIADDFSLADAQRVKEIEATTRHDVKAVEYLIREKLPEDCAQLSEFIHFACTSEDINNMSHALQLRDGLAVLRAAQDKLTDALAAFTKETLTYPMLAHTHGQPASPTTLGKEIAVVVHRLRRQAAEIDRIVLPAKMNGAVGNFNAHVSAAPEVNWPALAKGVIEGFGFSQNILTTQIESHDGMAELFDAIQRWNMILLDLDRDIWMYVSMKYLKQKVVAGEVGSSTMPHKINPIDFENSEGNIGLANAILGHLARKLPVSRMQRDLTDSTAIRNVGAGFAYSLIAVASTQRGLGRMSPNTEALAADLDHAWEVLAEPIQTVMRRYGVPQAYEKLKALTRGNAMTKETIAAFIQTLEIPEADKARLTAMTPADYIGLAAEISMPELNA
ncbi:MAG: adenylosuccinate lyase [bacterium]|nr:adenylosuccinate lyase [bacterium]